MNPTQLKEEYTRLRLAVNNDPEKEKQLNDYVNLYTLLEEIKRRERQTAPRLLFGGFNVSVWPSWIQMQRANFLIERIELRRVQEQHSADKVRLKEKYARLRASATDEAEKEKWGAYVNLFALLINIDVDRAQRQ